MALQPHASLEDRFWHWGARALAAAVLAYLVLPLLIIVPMSLTSGATLAMPLPGLSFKWYRALVEEPQWLDTTRNSLIVAVATTALSLGLGTLAALGLARARFKGRLLLVGLMVSPVVTPIVITAVALYFFFVTIDLVGTYLGLILAHTVLATPFVLVTVMAALAGLDSTILRAASGLGAPPITVFRRVTLPIILPGLVSGALFAFVTSWDEVVVALFIAAPEQRTLPRQIFSGVREYASPAIAAVATVLVLLSAALMTVVELLRRRAARLEGRARSP